MSLSLSIRPRAFAIRAALLGTVACATMFSALAASGAEPVESRLVRVNIPAKGLEAALIELSSQADVQILMSPQEVDGIPSAGLSGEYSLGEALDRLLSGSGLTYKIDAPGTITVMRVAAAPAPQRKSAAEAPAAGNTLSQGETGTLEEVVVTGVLTPQAPASVAVSVLSSESIGQMVPISAADLLRNVPGVFVNTALGEIRNVVYSRGISANSTEAASGYYYVSLQEDGLPVTNVTANNYGPDYFYRQDLSLGRLEALRGGTATVTGPNAPGGIFNYISKTGKSHPGGEIRLRTGLEGDGRNSFHRADFFGGGEVRPDLYYAVSGFYRTSDGPRDPGYPFNRGGQIKANLLWNYDGGSVQVYAKYLDDHNAWNEIQTRPRLQRSENRSRHLDVQLVSDSSQPAFLRQDGGRPGRALGRP